MQDLIICAIIIVLFLSAYFAKRRFGLLGLALAAGSLLSDIWAYDAGLMASVLGVPVTKTSAAVIAAIIGILPAFILLFHGYAYKTAIGRVIGATLFTFLALAFLIIPLGKVFAFSGQTAQIIKWLVWNRSLIIGSGMVVSVVDIFLTKPVSIDKKHKSH